MNEGSQNDRPKPVLCIRPGLVQSLWFHCLGCDSFDDLRDFPNQGNPRIRKITVQT